jgi:broad specificity phosphatase PhoE
MQTAELARLPQSCPVYSSPLVRAVQTAKSISERPIILPDLAEISYGEWDGLSWAEIDGKWPDLAREKLADWERVNAPGGEPWDRFRQRVQAALASILAGPLPAIVVAHEAVNALICEKLLNRAVQSYQQQYCEILIHEIRSTR